MDTSGGTRVHTEMDNGIDAADEIAVSKKRPRKTYQGLCPLCGVPKEINHTANHRAVVIASQADPDTGPLFERHGVNTLDDSFHIVLKIRRPGTWWSRLLARMVRLLLSPPTRLHHPTLDPASQGPFGFGYITKLLVFSLKHENLSEDSTARHVVAPFTLAFVLPWLSHVRARRTWAPQRRGRAAGQLHGGTRHSYNHYGWRARGP